MGPPIGISHHEVASKAGLRNPRSARKLQSTRKLIDSAGAVGFELPFLLLALSFVITALGAGSYSINAWAHVPNWAGIHWSMSDVARAAIFLAIGAGAGLVTVLGALAARAPRHAPALPAG